MASRTESPENFGDSSSSPCEDFDSGFSESSALGSCLGAAGSLQPQPASGEVLEIMGEELSFIEQQEHNRNSKIPYGSLDPAATIAGSVLKGGSLDFNILHALAVA